MKNKLLLGGLILSTTLLQAQTSDRKWNIGLHVGYKEYSGDLGSGFLHFDEKTATNTVTGGFTINRYLNKSFDFGVMGNYGSWGYFEDQNVVPTFKVDVLHLNGTFKYKFYNGYMIEESSFLQPYLIAGAGVNVMTASSTNSMDGDDLMGILGAGINFQLSDVVGLNYQMTYGYDFTSDDRDLNSTTTPNDAMLMQTVGLNFNIGKAPDADGDGVSDKKDKCPATPKLAKVDIDGCPIDSDKDGVADFEDACPNDVGSIKGCPDRDKDGVSDKDDQCPDVAGIVSLQGCPDTDGDGVIDSKDDCPNVRGVLAFAGCPDTDGDGIKDSEDKCPEVKGVKMFEGCPDTDGDSIPDMSDMCPQLKGPATTKGCPDTDLDGIHDGIDKCPTIAGVKENEGCPAVKKEYTQLFQRALQGIQFETGKAVIKKQSNGILDAIVKMMVDNPTFKLKIGGHTDNVGNDASNMTLSQNRADAVANYLIAHGVAPNRVTATGYGETSPVDTNKTKAGQARNRRVELDLEYTE
jgi:OOP family OmpA-OmpF porin